jgi:hypothetical protein
MKKRNKRIEQGKMECGKERSGSAESGVDK